VRTKKNAPDQLANMPIEELISIRERADQLITSRIAAEREALTAKLKAIQRFEAGTLRHRASDPVSLRSNAKDRRTIAAPKYRNPTTGETWAGRGMQPRWMRQAIEAGHLAEDFRIPK
jgi:DNA-binding protein H-NS